MDRTVKPMRSTREKQVLLLAHWFSGGLCQTCTALAAQRTGCPGFSEGQGVRTKSFLSNLSAIMQGAQPCTATGCAVGCSLYVYIRAASNGTL